MPLPGEDNINSEQEATIQPKIEKKAGKSLYISIYVENDGDLQLAGKIDIAELVDKSYFEKKAISAEDEAKNKKQIQIIKNRISVDSKELSSLKDIQKEYNDKFMALEQTKQGHQKELDIIKTSLNEFERLEGWASSDDSTKVYKELRDKSDSLGGWDKYKDEIRKNEDKSKELLGLIEEINVEIEHLKESYKIDTVLAQIKVLEESNANYGKELKQLTATT